jgi:hypothetical protein
MGWGKKIATNAKLPKIAKIAVVHLKVSMLAILRNL